MKLLDNPKLRLWMYGYLAVHYTIAYATEARAYHLLIVASASVSLQQAILEWRHDEEGPSHRDAIACALLVAAGIAWVAGA